MQECVASCLLLPYDVGYTSPCTHLSIYIRLHMCVLGDYVVIYTCVCFMIDAFVYIMKPHGPIWSM